MCSIGKDLDQSIGANSPSSTILGTGAIGTGGTGAKRVRGGIGTLLTGPSLSNAGSNARVGTPGRPNPNMRPV